MATFTVSGLVSGIDYNTMIEQLIALGRKPIDRKESRQEAYQTKISKFAELSSRVDTLKSAAENLKSATDFRSNTAESSGKDVCNVSASASAAEGTYELVVTRLAQAHRMASSAVASETDTVASGSGNFTFRVGSGEEVTVAVTASTTLNELAAAINSATDDAEASVINDGTGYRLVLKSAATGAANAITVTENATGLGLPVGPVSGGQTLREAQDAEFTIDGLSMTRSSNTVEGAIGGVSITLKNEGNTSISVTNDTAALQEKISAFVDAYNAIVDYISANDDYDSETGDAGAFHAESTARDILSRLKNIVATTVAGLPAELQSLSQIGIATDKDTGKLILDTSELSDAIASNLNGVVDLFAGAGGIGKLLYDYADGVSDSTTGSISYRKGALETVVADLADQIEADEARLEEEEERLIRQYANLEILLSQYNTQASYITGLLTT